MALPKLPNDYPSEMYGVRVIPDYIERPGGQPYIRFGSDVGLQALGAYVGTLHTTEGPYVSTGRATLGSKFAAATLCGPYSPADPAATIMPTRPPWAQHSALRDEGLPFHPNGYGPQIEMVERTRASLWTPMAPTLLATAAYMAWCAEVYEIPPESCWPGDPDGRPAEAEIARRKSKPPTKGGWTDHLFWGDGNDHGDCGGLRRSVLFKAAEEVLDVVDPRVEKFVLGLLDKLGDKDDPDKDASAAGAANRVAKAVRDHEKAGQTEPGEVADHEHGGVKR